MVAKDTIRLYNMYKKMGTPDIMVRYKDSTMNEFEPIPPRPENGPPEFVEKDPPIELYVEEVSGSKKVKKPFDYIRAYVEWKWKDGVKFDEGVILVGSRDTSSITTIEAAYTKSGTEYKEPKTVNVQVGGD